MTGEGGEEEQTVESIGGRHRWKASAVSPSPRGLQAPEAPPAAAWEGVPAVCQGETEAGTCGRGVCLLLGAAASV